MYFATFYYLETHPNPYISFKTPTTPEEILSLDMLKLSMAGGTAGCTCWISSYPADVIKSRLQTDGFSSKPIYNGTIDCIKKSYKAEGLSWMFKGLGPTLEVVKMSENGQILKTILKISIFCLIFCVFEISF